MSLNPNALRVQALAAAPIEQARRPTQALALALEPGPGAPARARQARYQALEALRRELGADVVAVGHTRDDQAETVLARLLRGSGVRGLRGIAPAREDAVVRPLIDCARADSTCRMMLLA